MIDTVNMNKLALARRAGRPLASVELPARPSQLERARWLAGWRLRAGKLANMRVGVRAQVSVLR